MNLQERFEKACSRLDKLTDAEIIQSMEDYGLFFRCDNKDLLYEFLPQIFFTSQNLIFSYSKASQEFTCETDMGEAA